MRAVMKTAGTVLTEAGRDAVSGGDRQELSEEGWRRPARKESQGPRRKEADGDGGE